jgi:hypothetical protein
MAQNYDQGMMTAFGMTLSMKTKSFYMDPFHALTNTLDEEDDDDTYKCFLSTSILESKYKKQTFKMLLINKLISQKHNKRDSIPCLQKEPNFKKMDLELLPNAHLIHSKPCPIPQIHQEVF